MINLICISGHYIGLIINNHDQSFKMKPNKTWPFPMAIFSHRVTYRKWYLVVGTSGRHEQSNNNIKIQSMASAFKVYFCVIWDKNINTIHYSYIKWWWLVNLFMQNIYFNFRSSIFNIFISIIIIFTIIIWTQKQCSIKTPCYIKVSDHKILDSDSCVWFVTMVSVESWQCWLHLHKQFWQRFVW